MMKPTAIHITATPQELLWSWAIYTHANMRDGVPTVQFVGCCPLRELFTLNDAHSNSQWANTFKGDENIQVSVIAITMDEREARTQQRELAMTYKAHCNMRGYHLGKKYQQVMCNETGERFRNATEAACSHGIALSNLYNHLNGKTGHRTVKGRTYRYVAPFTPTNIATGT